VELLIIAPSQNKLLLKECRNIFGLKKRKRESMHKDFPRKANVD